MIGLFSDEESWMLVKVFTCLALFMYVCEAKSASVTTATKSEVDHLIASMLVSPEKQQAALDEIVLNIKSTNKFLFNYLRDERMLSTHDIRILNVYPMASEKYMLTEAYFVDELVIKLLCPYTQTCDEEFSVSDARQREQQRTKLLAWCKANYHPAAGFCNPKRKGKKQLRPKRTEP